MGFQRHGFSVFMIKQLMKFGNLLQSIPNKVTPPPFRLMQIGSAYWQSRALYVAASLDLATVLGNDERSAEEVAKVVDVAPEALYRLLRFLAAGGVFAEKVGRVFANNKLSQSLRRDQEGNVRSMILLHNHPAMCGPWYQQLEQGIRKSEAPFQMTHGTDLFEYLDNNAELDQLFSDAMDGVEALLGESFAIDFDWGRFSRVIDIGGSKGSKSLSLLKHWPNLCALVFDRPQVISQYERSELLNMDSALRKRISWQAGDMLAGIPTALSSQDIYLLCAVLHGLDDYLAEQTLRNVIDAIGDTGASVAIMELVLPESGADLAEASFDMQMFVNSRGKERTMSQWRTLFDAVGLVLEESILLRTMGCILLLRKK